MRKVICRAVIFLYLRIPQQRLCLNRVKSSPKLIQPSEFVTLNQLDKLQQRNKHVNVQRNAEFCERVLVTRSHNPLLGRHLNSSTSTAASRKQPARPIWLPDHVTGSGTLQHSFLGNLGEKEKSGCQGYLDAGGEVLVPHAQSNFLLKIQASESWNGSRLVLMNANFNVTVYECLLHPRVYQMYVTKTSFKCMI